MSKKNGKSGKKRKSAKGGAKTVAKPKPPAGKAKVVKAKAGPPAEPDHLNSMAERLQQSAQAFRSDIAELLVLARKEGAQLSAKARKTFASVAKDYRKAAKDLKKFSSRKSR